MNKTSLPSKGKHIQDESLPSVTKLTEDNLKSILRSMHLKVTHQRLSILRILNKGPKSHVTAKDVFESIHTDHPNIGFATVYRFLKATSRFGITSELRIGSAPTRYELKTKDHHHHIVCTQCGKLVEFQNDIIEKEIIQISIQHHFQLEHHVFEIYGQCSDCPPTKK